MVSLIDVLPTYFDVAGVSISGRDGRSFTPVLLGGKAEHRDLILASHTGDGDKNVYPSKSARTRDFLYIRNLRPDLRFTTHIDRTHAPGDEYFRGWQAAAKAGDSAAQALLTAYHQRPAEELYDLRGDPAQTRNLAAEPRVRAVKARLAGAVDHYRQSFADAAPLSGPAVPQPQGPIWIDPSPGQSIF